MISRPSFRPVLALALAAAVALAAMYAARLVRVPPESFFPPSFVTHSAMLALSVAAMWLLSKGRLDLYGLTKGAYKFSPRIFLWVLPTAALSVLSAVASPGGHGTGGPSGFTKPQLVVFIWIYASISEETLTRGLLQTLLSGNAKVGAAAPRRLSMPVLVSGLFFGSMHIVLVKSMGPAAVPVILLAVFLGLVAARYRERTGSLLPAIIIHALFNIGGMLPLWVIQWLRG
jgi:membrane protease YdiL (CAAX protease family)